MLFNFKSLICNNCTSVMLNLPEVEYKKLSGMHLRCECCGHIIVVKK